MSPHSVSEHPACFRVLAICMATIPLDMSLACRSFCAQVTLYEGSRNVATQVAASGAVAHVVACASGADRPHVAAAAEIARTGLPRALVGLLQGSGVAARKEVSGQLVLPSKSPIGRCTYARQCPEMT